MECCCIIGGNFCDELAVVIIYSRSGDTLSCSRHIFDLLEDGENHIVYLGGPLGNIRTPQNSREWREKIE